MGYQAGGTDYTGFLSQEARADEGLTRALKEKGERDRQARIKKSGQRSGLSKMLSAAARGAAAYYTGGMSEQLGAGSMIDEAMLGTDSEGRAVRNEYGELAGMASQIGSGMSAKKAGEAALKLQQQSARDDAMQSRLDRLDPELGMEFALKREKKDASNLAALQKHKGGFHGLMNTDVEGVDFKPTTTGDWQNVLNKAKTPEAQTMDYTKMLERKGDQPGFVPPKPQEAEPKEGTVALSTKDLLEQQRKIRENLKGVGSGRPPLIG